MPPIPSRLPYRVLTGCVFDVLPTLPEKSVHCCVTSPPYFGLRDYGVAGQIGLEQSPEEYADKLVKVFREVKRVLCDDGTLWLNLGDSYAAGGNGGHRESASFHGHTERNGADMTGKAKRVPGFKPKDLIGIPWRVAFALQADGWYLRSDIIWHKPNQMPESVRDRPTKSHEYLFLLAKSASYYYDADAVRGPHSDGTLARPSRLAGQKAPQKTRYGDHNIDGRSLNPNGRNRRSVWTVATRPYKGAHFATFPEKLIEPCVLAGSPEGGTVLDPFAGAGTTLVVATKNSRRSIGVELNPEYVKLIHERMAREGLNTPVRRTQCT